ncbi:DUF3466 family protein [Thalassotalea euphylliae]|uniref:DUF3466 family protein n=1 Tax=Thalassotalea euphylliae TaxID=1655234 RepID=UPI0036271E63
MNNIVKSLVAVGVASAISIANAATYTIVDKGDVSSLKYTYTQQENASSETAISGTELYNFPVQFDELDEDDYDSIVNLADATHEIVLALENIENEELLRAGTPTANDFAWTVRWLSGRNNNFYQRVGDQVAMINDGIETKEVVVFDEPFEGTDTLTRSVSDFANGISDRGWLYGNGSAPYLPLVFTDSDGDDDTWWLRDFNTRAFVSVDNGESVIPVLPPETSFYEGESAILDMRGLIAVGYASVSTNPEIVERIEDETGGCADPDVVDDIPYLACVQNLSANLYNLNAYIWRFDESGNIVDEEALGILVTPAEGDDRTYQSFGQAVNSQGVVVGYSHAWIDETETTPGNNEDRWFYAFVYKDGEMVSLTRDHSEYYDSRAYDINDAGIAVGHARTSVNGRIRSKFYYIDTNVPSEELQLIFPEDFFTGSSSTARAINEQGFVVGEGEVETQNSELRRTHGFLYDINNETFTDLNDFLSCDSAYTIIEARDINELNEISATAIVKVPRRDSYGELMFDDNGDQLVEDVVRAVTMKPIDGEIEDCSEVEEKVERNGASFGFGLFAFLLGLGVRRLTR